MKTRSEKARDYKLGVSDGKSLKKLGLSSIALHALITHSGLCRKVKHYYLYHYHQGLNDTLFGKKNG